MIPKPKVMVILSCWSLLTLGFCIAAQAADKPLARERSILNVPAHTTMASDRIQREDDTREGIKTIEGQVFRLKGQHVYVRKSDGRRPARQQ